MSERRAVENLVEILQARAKAGATMVELIDLVHDAAGAPRYSRGLVLSRFHAAFAALGPLDLTALIFACEIFGDGATVGVAETERRFRIRLAELGLGPVE